MSPFRKDSIFAVVVDGLQGEQSLRALERQYGTLPDGDIVKIGPRRHLLRFLLPAGITIRPRDHVLGAGLSIVTPSSLTETCLYETCDASLLPSAPAEWLLAFAIASFTAADIAKFAGLDIPPDLLRAAGIERVDNYEARFKGFSSRDNPTADLSGIVFPYRSLQTGYVTTHRLRLDTPVMMADGRPAKYLSPPNSRKHIFYPPGAAEKLENPTTKIVYVESEISALMYEAAFRRRGRHDLVPAAVGGCWGWMGKGVRHYIAPNGERVDFSGPLPDLYDAHNRVVCVAFDADASSNPKVQDARLAFVRELYLPHRGCTVRAGDVPEVDCYV